MPETTGTSGRPLTSTTNQEHLPEGNTIHPPSSTSTQDHNSSRLSDDSSPHSKTTKPRRRPGTTPKAPSSPHDGPSRSKQRSTAGSSKMQAQPSSINLTRTGRISKAKKGLKVHNCHCGRSYTRAEHLRRHQKNHAQDEVLVCNWPDCGKPFYRPDLLIRHRERHNEPGGIPIDQEFTPEPSPEAHHEPLPVTTPALLTAATLPPAPEYLPMQPVSPHGDMHTIPRYTMNPFRTPQLPQTPRLPSSGFTSHSSPTSRFNVKHVPYTSHRNTPASVSVQDGMAQYGWHEQSYSPSSDYASPSIAPGDYGTMYPIHGYGHSASRTRTPSIASLHDPWALTPRSPSSSNSTMPYTWASNDKMPTAPSLAYINTSYPMVSHGISTNMDAAAGYGHFEPKTMMQRDEDEATFLYRDQAYGMGQLAHTYPSEQYLNNYWRLFHPTFPVVHRPTFGGMSSSPMLYAAMIAIDGQYSNDTNTKRTSRMLHDRCIKMLEKREREPMAEPDRLCDYQTVFLVEVLAQFRARRAAKTLSPRLGSLYHKASINFRQVTSQLTELVLAPNFKDIVTLTYWLQWVELATWQRLLTSCFILESQQATLLARTSLSSLFSESGMDLPLPVHTSVWDAMTLNAWATAAEQHAPSPQYVFEVTPRSMLIPCDSFQSSVIIAAYYSCSDISSPSLVVPPVEEVDQVLDPSFNTNMKLLTAKLTQVIPLRALLAVSGESWILSEKVSSPQEYTSLKTTLRTWVSQLWSMASSDTQLAACKEALRISIDILQLAMERQPEASELGMGSDMGIYFASLVLWAITTHASTRAAKSNQASQAAHYRHNSQPPSFTTIHNSASMPSTPIQMSSSFPIPTTMDMDITSSSHAPFHSLPATPSRHDSLGASTLLSHDQIAFNSLSFLSDMLTLASAPHQHLDINVLQMRCISLLMWVKVQLRGTSNDEHADLAMWATRPGDGLGELLDSVVGSLERILNKGWSGWGI